MAGFGRGDVYKRQVWPKPGKMSALIARSLLQNAKATFNVSSSPGRGTRVTIDFAQADATPASD